MKYQVLQDVFGFDSFRLGQEAVIDAVLAGRDALAVMPTGGGKSLCFQVPALVRGGLTVVVSPLVALMQDQVAALRLAGVAADAIHSLHPRAENVAIWRRVAAGETRLLYLAPERLMTERMLAALSRLPISLFAVDEAHCISQWGPSFRPEYAALSALRPRFPDVPILALTATADEVTREDISARLLSPDAAQFVAGFDRPNIRLAVEPRNSARRQLLAFVKQRRGQSGIVYCLSRRKVEQTAALLESEGFRALPYHAGMAAEDRNANQDIFIAEPGVVIVATIAFGMGIDKPDVRYVFHTDMRTFGSNLLELHSFFSRILQLGNRICNFLFPGCNRDREKMNVPNHPHRRPRQSAQGPQDRIRHPRWQAHGLRRPRPAFGPKTLLRPRPASRRAHLEDRGRRRDDGCPPGAVPRHGDSFRDQAG